MPNWCTNSFQIKADRSSKDGSASFEKIIKILENDENIFKSDSFYPTPVELRKVISGSTTIDGTSYHHWLEVAGKQVALPKKMEKDLLEKYGHLNWYDWNIHNLGTKWHFKSYDVVDITNDVISFGADTAWSPPTQFCCNMSTEFPGIHIKLAFIETGMGFAGVENIFDGEVISSEDFEPKWVEAKDRWSVPTQKWLDRHGL
jgi:hypothetical protein